MDYYPVQGGAKIFLVASCYGDRQNGPPGSNVELPPYLCNILLSLVLLMTL